MSEPRTPYITGNDPRGYDKHGSERGARTPRDNNRAAPQGRWISVEDELPAYDREVVVLIQDYPNDDEHLRVAFGHRPNPNGWVTKDGERLYAMTYDKGGWNGKNIRYWLDVKLPNEH